MCHCVIIHASSSRGVGTTISCIRVSACLLVCQIVCECVRVVKEKRLKPSTPKSAEITVINQHFWRGSVFQYDCTFIFFQILRVSHKHAHHSTCFHRLSNTDLLPSHLSTLHLAQLLESGIFSLQLSICVTTLTPFDITSDPLAPQIRLRLTIVSVYKLHFLTYLLV